MASSSPVAAQPRMSRARKHPVLVVYILNWLHGTGRRDVFVAIVLLAHAGIFVKTIMTMLEPEYSAYVGAVGICLPIARAAAGVLRLNVSFLFITMSRRSLALLRKVPVLSTLVPVDVVEHLHIVIGSCFVLFSFVHVCAHYYNFLVLGNITTHSSFWYSFFSGPGWTGQVANILIFLIATSAVAAVRQRKFEVFWFTHHLFIALVPILMFHGSYCFVKHDDDPPCHIGGLMWKYAAAGATLYGAERLARELISRFPTRIKCAIVHPGNVIEVHFAKFGARARAGQYIWINCPTVSVPQWHPFTLTSSEYDMHLSVHIKVAGDWTKEFYNIVANSAIAKNSSTVNLNTGDRDSRGDFHIEANQDPPRVLLDGPFGRACDGWVDYKTVVCIGAGIGVTPFASILRTIMDTCNSKKETEFRSKKAKRKAAYRAKTEKVYFIWTCRKPENFAWFQSLLYKLEQECSHMMDIRIFLTGALGIDEVANVMMYESSGGSRDYITKLQSRTFYGRPKWNDEFSRIRKLHSNECIGVFFCGPRGLAKELQTYATQHTLMDRNGVYFFFRWETI